MAVKILKFPKVVGLEWFEPAIEDAVEAIAEKLQYTYKYLLWSRRYQLVERGPSSPEGEVAYGMLLKYHRQMMGMDIPPHEQALIDKAEQMLAESNAEIKRKKAAKG